ncbi:MAG: hypothetical protein LBU12_00375 [Deltaproteobacteria bacterium]|nr:hypothetical protein [Deltaproteobacteria bacterium]
MAPFAATAVVVVVVVVAAAAAFEAASRRRLRYLTRDDNRQESLMLTGERRLKAQSQLIRTGRGLPRVSLPRPASPRLAGGQRGAGRPSAPRLFSSSRFDRPQRPQAPLSGGGRPRAALPC